MTSRETNDLDLAAHFLATSLDRFGGQKSLAEAALAQLENRQLHEVPFDDGNSIVIVMKHLAGNMRSRWTDFLTTDGEKADRGRDGEFVDDLESREQLDALWDAGWATLLGTIRSLDAEDVAKTVTIRGEPHSVVEAIQRQIAHYGYHVGQIVQLARALKGSDWVSLSVPRGGSGAYNDAMGHGPEA